MIDQETSLRESLPHKIPRTMLTRASSRVLPEALEIKASHFAFPPASLDKVAFQTRFFESSQFRWLSIEKRRYGSFASI